MASRSGKSLVSAIPWHSTPAIAAPRRRSSGVRRILIGLGASAISEFPDRLLQNAKKAGDWHQAISAGRCGKAGYEWHRAPVNRSYRRFLGTAPLQSPPLAAGNFPTACFRTRRRRAIGTRQSAPVDSRPRVVSVGRNVSFAAACASGSCGLAKWSKPTAR
jgi:hypothetical protein